MDGDAILAILEAHGPAQTSELVELLAAEGVEETTTAVSAALRKLESAGTVAHTPRENWRLTGTRARAASEARRAARQPKSSGVRTRALIYCPEIIRDAPRLTRNTVLHYVSYEHGGFRLRDYVDGHRIEVKEVAGIDKTVFLEAAYAWTQFEFDADDAATPLTDNDWWEKRLAAVNKANAKLLAEGEAATRKAKG